FSAHAARAKVPAGVMLPIARFADLPLDAVAELLEACRRRFGQPAPSRAPNARRIDSRCNDYRRRW
ncbi:hypothetical protein QM326_37525, partial [Burkholderia cenocepacia]|nr:hypothetical protein [Burkholderia cenocepacia]